MPDHSYTEALAQLVPELLLVTTALVALGWDLWTKGRNSSQVGYISLGGLVLTAVALFGQWGQESVTVFRVMEIDQFGNFFKLFTVASLIVVMFFVLQDRNERKHNIGEYYFLLLGGAIGAFFMVSTNNLLVMVLGLELLSLCSYALAGFHKGDRRSAEASMKYVVFGGLSSGLMVFGISLLYGLTGTLDMAVMGTAGSEGMPIGLMHQLESSPIPVAIAVVLTLSGFAYKVSVAPFHFWTPDVYQGAPTPVTTFLAVGSKAAGFAVLLRFLGAIFMQDGVQESVARYGLDVGLLLGVLAAVTMTIGNLSALGQSSLKRMLAYSSIAHAGYVLVGMACMSGAGFEAAMYYLAAYYFMNLGAFGFLLYFEGVTGKDTVESLEGMGPKAPLISCVMVAFLVSLTGIPPSVGFYGKWLLFWEGINADLMWLVVVMGLNSVISLFYYMRVAKALFLAAPSEQEAKPQPGMAYLLLGMGVLTIGLGLYVTPLVAWVGRSFDLLG